MIDASPSQIIEGIRRFFSGKRIVTLGWVVDGSLCALIYLTKDGPKKWANYLQKNKIYRGFSEPVIGPYEVRKEVAAAVDRVFTHGITPDESKLLKMASEYPYKLKKDGSYWHDSKKYKGGC